MEDDWDMCESILKFSGKKEEAKPKEDEFKSDDQKVETETKSEESPSEPSTKTEPKDEVPKTDKTKSLAGSLNCVYHGVTYRNKFQQLLNLLRTKPNLLPEQYVMKVGQAVCICKSTPSKYKLNTYSRTCHLRSLFWMGQVRKLCNS